MHGLLLPPLIKGSAVLGCLFLHPSQAGGALSCSLRALQLFVFQFTSCALEVQVPSETAGPRQATATSKQVQGDVLASLILSLTLKT